MPTTKDGQALARAVTWGGGSATAMPLDAENKWTGERLTLDAALDRGCAFMVEPAPWLVAYDLDTAELVEAGRRLAAALPAAADYVRVESQAGSTGEREHLWVRIPPGWTKDKFKSWAEEAEPCLRGQNVFRGNRNIRPPLSPHRQGGRGRLLEPKTTARALKVLSRPGISPEMQELVLRGDTHGKYKYKDSGPSRVVTAQAIASAYVNAYRSAEEFLADMLNPQNRAGAKWQQSGEVQKLRVIFDQQTQFVAERPPDVSTAAGLAAVDRITAAAQGLGKGGKQGQSDYTVLRALCAIAADAGKTTITASQRQLAENTGMARATVARALKRLENDGWVTPFRGAQQRDTTTYRLHEKHGTSPLASLEGEQEVNGSVPFASLLSHDAFAWGGLPKGSLFTYSALSAEQPREVAEIVAARKPPAHAKTVREHLLRLQSAGLADSHGRRWVALPITQEKLERVALLRSTAGASHRRRDRHIAERANFEERLGRFSGRPAKAAS